MYTPGQALASAIPGHLDLPTAWAVAREAFHHEPLRILGAWEGEGAHKGSEKLSTWLVMGLREGSKAVYDLSSLLSSLYFPRVGLLRAGWLQAAVAPELGVSVPPEMPPVPPFIATVNEGAILGKLLSRLGSVHLLHLCSFSLFPLPLPIVRLSIRAAVEAVPQPLDPPSDASRRPRPPPGLPPRRRRPTLRPAPPAILPALRHVFQSEQLPGQRQRHRHRQCHGQCAGTRRE